MDLNRATEITPEVSQIIEDMFLYHPWTHDQAELGRDVRNSLATALHTIIRCVPPCPDRSAAIRKIREARMDCNSAITHGGKY